MNNIKRTDYLVNETITQKSAEQSIDMEMNLPDYCADIQNILQCFAFANVTSGSITEGVIKIEGTILVRVLYLNDGEIYSYEQSEPFIKRIDNDNYDVGAVMSLNTALQYINSRATGSRKMEVHGAFHIDIKISACHSATVIDEIEEKHIQVNKDTLSACTACANASASTTVNQVIDIGTDKPPISSIIRTTSTPYIVETKQVNGKILIKAEVKIKTLYKSENASVEYVENTLPLSQILDIEGMDENSTVDIKIKLSSLDITIKPSALGNMSLLDISVSTMINACAYNCIDFPVVKDAYSTEYGCDCTFKEVCVDRIVTTLSKEYLHEYPSDVITDIATVIDVWCDEMRTNASLNNNELILSGSFKAYVLYEDTSGVLNLKAKQTDFSFSESMEDVCQIKCYPEGIILGTDYVIAENHLDLRTNIKINAVVFESKMQKVIDEIRLSENPIEKASAIYIYYAKKQEKLWNIARKFHTTVAHIMKDNDMESDVMEADMPLIISD